MCYKTSFAIHSFLVGHGLRRSNKQAVKNQRITTTTPSGIQEAAVRHRGKRKKYDLDRVVHSKSETSWVAGFHQYILSARFGAKRCTTRSQGGDFWSEGGA